MAETKKKIVNKKVTSKKQAKRDYLFAVGRRKTAIARVRLYPNQRGEIEVNGFPIESYFPGETMKALYLLALRTCNVIGKYLITIKAEGSGKNSQLGAVSLGISRVLVKLNEEKFKPILKKRGLLTRDPRAKERRKAGTGGKARRQKQSPRR
ncbi:30S ribosomal protein S9 [Candidatus Beckwithbacteria bacterium RBG_13_42_9]|uniref:Small ribosomal subunit protein uS9 n=1 Tax=Candidatus Beckwithbacteria bacterium RBG_13_42_9 TaxID=1797457 RepID=A0A1F5E8Y9_9BACT|nr:MAG: 30S ribosomal protein S9 [Candidatus Beckwithbacteria bacterium RBG_13_42_9]